jgi:AcrR family transcriptional regulator
MEETTMRRRPRQSRSLQRVTQVLNAAAELFSEIGYEATTTNAIATRAGIPIGSLYQFFPNKEAIAEALSKRYVTEMRTLLDARLSPEITAGLSLTLLISQFIEGLTGFKATHAGFEAIFMDASFSLQGSAATQSLHEEVIQRVDRLLASRFPSIPAEARQLHTRVSVAIVKGLMRLSEPPDNLPTDLIADRTTYALLAYVRATLVEQGIPLPSDLQ